VLCPARFGRLTTTEDDVLAVEMSYVTRGFQLVRLRSITASSAAYESEQWL
jgi:hypothetical protein